MKRYEVELRTHVLMDDDGTDYVETYATLKETDNGTLVLFSEVKKPVVKLPEDEHGCHDCKYLRLTGDKEPCATCVVDAENTGKDSPNWEPKEGEV